MDCKEKQLNKVICGDCLKVMKELLDNSIDCIVTDPPYQLCSTKMGFHRGKQGTVFTRTGKGGFMGKEWDVLPSVEIWQECLRVLKPGAFAFVMCCPRQDSLGLMIYRLTEAGFQTGFTSIYWAYASGFPKASNIGKMVDKRGYENEKYTELSKELCDYLKLSREKLNLSQKDIAKNFLSKTGGLTGCVWNWENGANIPTMKQWKLLKKILKLDNEKFIEFIERAILKREEAEREITGHDKHFGRKSESLGIGGQEWDKKDIPTTKQAKSLDGSYGGFQPKPAVEIILVVMKPLSEKTYVDQAMNNKKGVTWFDDGRIPISAEDRHKYGIDGDEGNPTVNCYGEHNRVPYQQDNKGRFPANLLVSDDVLDDGLHKSGDNCIRKQEGMFIEHKLGGKNSLQTTYGDEGSFSRFFSLDAWFKEKLKDLSPTVQKIFPFLIVPKASKSEKNEGLDHKEEQQVNDGRNKLPDNAFQRGKTFRKNTHPTCKPLKLMFYLITIGSREGDIILDPFAGSCTTGVACIGLNRQYIMCEKEKEYFEIGKARLDYAKSQLKLL